MPLEAILSRLGVSDGTVAVAGLFDLFLSRLTSFHLSEKHELVLPGGIPCFSTGHPRAVLAGAGLRPASVGMLDAAPMVTTTLWASGQAGAE
jgi:hypothetical protein